MRPIKATHKDALRAAVSVLKHGGIIVYPTDTAYALGCDATSKIAVRRIYQIKKREKGKPLPVIVANKAMAREYTFWNKQAEKLARQWWPGPLTMVLKAKRRLPILGPGQSLALRVPDLTIARQLSQFLGRPIVSTSANISGKPVCYSIACVLRQFRDLRGRTSAAVDVGRLARRPTSTKLPDLILDAGRLPRRKPSTIIKVYRGRLEILRRGAIHLS